MWEALGHQWVGNFAQVGMAFITLITTGLFFGDSLARPTARLGPWRSVLKDLDL